MEWSQTRWNRPKVANSRKNNQIINDLAGSNWSTIKRSIWISSCHSSRRDQMTWHQKNSLSEQMLYESRLRRAARHQVSRRTVKERTINTKECSYLTLEKTYCIRLPRQSSTQTLITNRHTSTMQRVHLIIGKWKPPHQRPQRSRPSLLNATLKSTLRSLGRKLISKRVCQLLRTIRAFLRRWD